jgi:hypothetical protein
MGLVPEASPFWRCTRASRMNLAGILPLIEDALGGGLPPPAAPSVIGVSDGAKACFLAVLSRRLAVPPPAAAGSTMTELRMLASPAGAACGVAGLQKVHSWQGK